ncbi:MAG TPA: DUF4390 domain-containing protein [Gemmatimonadales bacterium]|nr:DUF4390 domain-containing protein [Gemmatimonadales bacterium]
MRRLAALLLPLAALAARARAQDPVLTVTVQDSIPRIQTSALLADGKFADLMRSGFPLRLHYRLELWRSRSSWFDQFVSDAGWDAVARYDPLADDFVLIRSGGSITRYATVEELERAFEIPYRVTLEPKSGGRFYYFCRLDVSTLNDTDLQELEGWLKGDVGATVKTGGSLGSSLARGLQRALVRIAGLPRLTLEARSVTFPYPL